MRVLVLPCDGIGPEIISSAMKVLHATDLGGSVRCQAFGELVAAAIRQP